MKIKKPRKTYCQLIHHICLRVTPFSLEPLLLLLLLFLLVFSVHILILTKQTKTGYFPFSSVLIIQGKRKALFLSFSNGGLCIDLLDSFSQLWPFKSVCYFRYFFFIAGTEIVLIFFFSAISPANWNRRTFFFLAKEENSSRGSTLSLSLFSDYFLLAEEISEKNRNLSCVCVCTCVYSLIFRSNVLSFVCFCCGISVAWRFHFSCRWLMWNTYNSCEAQLLVWLFFFMN